MIPTGYQICEKCVMDTTDNKIKFNKSGVCDYCQNFIKRILPHWQMEETSKSLEKKINEIKIKGKNSKYDCLIGISGGVDSTFLTHLAVKQLKLRPLIFHVDAGWNSQEAVNNIEKIIEKLKLDLHTEVIDWNEMKDLQAAHIKAQVPHLDAPQDHAFFGSLYNFAVKNNFKYILTGANYSTEGIREPLDWAYHASDLRQIKDIHKKFGTMKIKKFPYCGIFKYKIYFRYFKGLQVVQPLNYIKYHKQDTINFLEKEYNWQKYPYKHYESRFTKFFEGYWLRKKFGYEKRRAHYSSLILTNQMKREEAIQELKRDPYDPEKIQQEFDYVAKKLDMSQNELKFLMEGKNKNYKDYKSMHWFIQFCVILLRLFRIEKRIIR